MNSQDNKLGIPVIPLGRAKPVRSSFDFTPYDAQKAFEADQRQKLSGIVDSEVLEEQSQDILELNNDPLKVSENEVFVLDEVQLIPPSVLESVYLQSRLATVAPSVVSFSMTKPDQDVIVESDVPFIPETSDGNPVSEDRVEELTVPKQVRELKSKYGRDPLTGRAFTKDGKLRKKRADTGRTRK